MAEGARLESVYTFTGIGGSNPSLSAITFVISHLRRGDTTTELQGSAYKAPEKPPGQLPATLADRPVAKRPGNSVNPPQ